MFELVSYDIDCDTDLRKSKDLVYCRKLYFDIDIKNFDDY